MSERLATDVAVPALLVLLGAALLAAALGAWPPLVAVETGSMEPTVERGDLVVVASVDRFPWGGVNGDEIRGGAGNDDGTQAPDAHGPVDREVDDHEHATGDVIVFTRPNDDGAPILHRVAFAVEAGEDWTRRADPERTDGDCEELRYCPAPHGGYVTYGDANDEYDQSAGIAPVVAPTWIDAKAVATIPNAGWPRLAMDVAIDRFGTAPVLVSVVWSGAVLGGVGSIVLGRLREDPPT